MSLSESQIQTALKEITDPNTGKDFIASKVGKKHHVLTATMWRWTFVLGYPAKSQSWTKSTRWWKTS